MSLKRCVVAAVGFFAVSGTKTQQQGIDVGGMEQALKHGGAKGLNEMLSSIEAMSLMHSGDTANLHIKKDANGNEIYDFTDHADATPAPPPPTPRPAPIPSPAHVAPPTVSAVSRHEHKASAKRGLRPASTTMNEPAAPSPPPMVQPQIPQQMTQSPVPQQFQQPQQQSQPQMQMQMPMPMQQPQMMAMPQQYSMPQQYYMPQQWGTQNSAPLTGKAALEQNVMSMKHNLDAMMNALGMSVQESDDAEDESSSVATRVQSQGRRLEKRMKQLEKKNAMLQKQLHSEKSQLKSVEAKQKKEDREIKDATRDNDKLRKKSSLLSKQVTAHAPSTGVKEFFHHKPMPVDENSKTDSGDGDAEDQ